MKGQWIGEIQADHPYEVILDLEDAGQCYHGYIVMVGLGTSLPTVVAEVQTDGKVGKQTLDLAFRFLHPRTQEVMADEAVDELFPARPKSTKVTLEEVGGTLAIEWTTDTGASGTLVGTKSETDLPSEIRVDDKVGTWLDFKAACDNLNPEQFIFRGQPTPKRLRTAFHRTGRVNLVKYVVQDLPEVHRALSGRTRHIFNLQSELGAFLNLIQHHGFPTPLLDWTRSPFVAAFFAFRDKAAVERTETVRVFKFDAAAWRADFGQLERVMLVGPHASIARPLGIENPRAIPQQALSMLTNLDDIEAYIARREIQKNKIYLTAYDIPATERIRVMRDLSLMGITSGSLFPGLDGACQELRDEIFDFRAV